MNWCAKAFGWGRLDVERVDELLAEWSIDSVKKNFIERIGEDPNQDVVGLLYQCLADEANSILGREIFTVYPNCIATQIVCEDEEFVFDYIKDAESWERRILETALEEAGVEVPQE